VSIRMGGVFDMEGLKVEGSTATRALEEGMGIVHDRAVELVPKLSGHLASTARVEVLADNLAQIKFSGPYAKFQHEYLDLKHPNGQAKYLETALLEKSDDALAKVAEIIRGAL